MRCALPLKTTYSDSNRLPTQALPWQALHQFLKDLEEALYGLGISLTKALNDPLVELFRARRDDKLCPPKQRVLIEDSSSTIEVIQGKTRAHRLMKEGTLLSVEGVKYLGVRSILLSATKITETFPALEEPNGVVLKEHAVHQEINRDGVAISVCPDWNLERYTLLHVEVRDELL
jgi:hypothetical protein